MCQCVKPSTCNIATVVLALTYTVKHTSVLSEIEFIKEKLFVLGIEGI